jgi:hypothetical protein
MRALLVVALVVACCVSGAYAAVDAETLQKFTRVVPHFSPQNYVFACATNHHRLMCALRPAVSSPP